MSILSWIWPRQDAPAVINPEAIFQTYESAIETMSNGLASADDPKLLAQSWKIFDNEAARRNTIDSRAAAMMPATNLAATLVTGVSFTVLKDDTIPFVARCIILGTFVLALVYLVRTTVLLLKIHGRVFRSTLDPSDLPPAPPPAAPPQPPPDPLLAPISPYDRAIACKILRYTVLNYRVNNVQTDALFVAQHAFRNAIYVIVFGGTIAAIVLFIIASWPKPAVPLPLLPG